MPRTICFSAEVFDQPAGAWLSPATARCVLPEVENDILPANSR
jgi:hypothetical protein